MKIRTLKIKSALFLVSIGLFWSCSDEFLSPEPTGSMKSDEIFESYVTADAALVGAYDQLSGYTFEGMWVPLMSDIMGEDIMINAVNNWGWFVPVYQMNLLAGYTYTNYPWSTAYKVIFDANHIIANAQNVPDASAEQRNDLEGQAKVLRAFSHLKLIQMYAPAYSVDPDVPGVMNANRPMDANSDNFGRASVREGYNQVVSDLTSAISLLEDNSDKGFFDKRAAQAILARTYLDMEEWELARDMAKSAYEGISLMTINEMYNGFFSRNSETIFTVAYTSEDNNTYMSIPSFYWPVAGYSSMRADIDFVNLFDNMDYRSSFFVLDPGLDPDRHLILKFAHNQQVGNAERISIRAAEMYLIAAECEAELGNDALAQDELFVVQNRAFPGVGKSTATGQELIDEVLVERRKELFGEGFRWNDIKRRSLPFKRQGNHWVKFDFDSNSDDYYRLTFPIPQAEIDANPLINQEDQNKGY